MAITARRFRWHRSLQIMLLLGIAPAILGQQRAPVFRSSTEIARLHVSVVSGQGTPVTDLRVSDFTVLEDGEPRPISVFFPPEEGPVEIVLVADASQSMAMWDSRSAFHALLDRLHPESCVLFLPFRDRVLGGTWGRPNDPALRLAVDEQGQFGQEETTYDALVVAYSELRNRASGSSGATMSSGDFGLLLGLRSPVASRLPRLEANGQCAIAPSEAPGVSSHRITRAVVVVTDEPDEFSIATLGDVVLAAWGSDIPLFALAATREIREGSTEIRGRLPAVGHVRALEDIAAYTGGFVFGQTVGMHNHSLMDGITQLQQALRGLYLLGYEPSGPVGQVGLIENSKIKVRVNRDHVKVLATSNLARGRGGAEGAAVDLVQDGFDALASGELQRSLTIFENATAIGDQLGLAHFGRALALSEAGLHSEALPSLQRAQQLAPWLPHLDLRLAATQLKLGDSESAWQSALRAHWAGADVSVILEELQRVAPREVDLTGPPPNPRVAVSLDGHGAIHALLAAPMLAGLVHRLATESPNMQGSWDGQAHDLLLVVEVADARQRGPWIEVKGWLRLRDREGEELGNERFSVRNVEDEANVEAVMSRAFARIEQTIIEMSQDSH